MQTGYRYVIETTLGVSIGRLEEGARYVELLIPWPWRLGRTAGRSMCFYLTLGRTA